MINAKHLRAALLGGTCAIAWIGASSAETFNIPAGDLKSALTAYSKQTGVALIVSGDAINGAKTSGVKGDLPDDAALTRILSNTGFVMHRHPSGAVAIVPGQSSEVESPIRLAQVTQTPRQAVETVTVTSSKLGGADVQSIPIAITALSQEQLTATQTAGGPDLVKQVPNLTFTKTNFTGYSIQIRGIGTQAISVATDPAVAVAFNDTPFIRNHFFEQEFYDVSQVEVLRGPQGTLYGRNATAGVVNVISATPTDHWEAAASVDVGNYNNRRMEGMLNVPIVDERLDLRVAGEWTKRDGYSFNETTGRPIDGRDLWSTRVTLGIKPFERLQAYAIWEHFDEDDDRTRSSKQLCKRDPGPDSVDGPSGLVTNLDSSARAWLSQGCLPGSLYAPTAFQTPNAGAIPFVGAAEYIFNTDGHFYIHSGANPYSGVTQSTDLRVIASELNPAYRAKNDTFELNATFNINDSLSLVSQTGYGKDALYSTQDYNRFNTAPGLFVDLHEETDGTRGSLVGPGGVYCDPQLGCSSRLVGEDISRERAWQFSQEARLASSFSGPLNFSIGANYLRYQTVEDYFVFFNLITLEQERLNGLDGNVNLDGGPFDPIAANACNPQPADVDSVSGQGLGCAYVDPNPLSQIDGDGHNYFRSQNPYKLHSWAGFGEVYYQIDPELKLTGGLRWTDDIKHFDQIPSWTLVRGKGYPIVGVVDQEWKKWTGHLTANWTPKLDFTDQTMVYGSYSRGYKGGGANPPGPVFFGIYSSPSVATHPLTFEPEFVDAFEVGTKNTLLDGSLTMNGDIFYYNYKNYQISTIVDRTSINLNFDATVKGAELTASWEPIPGLRFNFAGGYEDTAIAKGSQAIDLMDRTAGHSDWMLVKPFVSQTSNCILPTKVVNQMISQYRLNNGASNSEPVPSGINGENNGLDVNSGLPLACFAAYSFGIDPRILVGADTTGDEFNPADAPNGGQGFAKDLGGNELPNTPHVTISLGAQYSMPLSEDWVGTLRGDFYAQTGSWARVFNDDPYDRLHGYTNFNFALTFTNQDGWQAMAYVKNALDTTAITGAFLNSDDTALTTNVFLTDPRLFGIRITKNW
jgi:outer membrane receptor protein involved in Fe transport